MRKASLITSFLIALHVYTGFDVEAFSNVRNGIHDAKNRNRFVSKHLDGVFARIQSASLRMVQPNESELAEQKQECVASLADFNDGTWIGYSLSSFSLTSDVAAGPTNRVDFSSSDDSPYLYKTHVRTIVDADGLKMQETFEWPELASASPDESGLDETLKCAKIKSIRLAESADVDSVDGSYSVDVPLLDLPFVISGTKTIIKFGIEHSLAINDEDRTRCFLLYGMDDRLIRVVISNEKKIRNFDENIQDINDVNNMVGNIIDKMDINEKTKINGLIDNSESDEFMSSIDRLTKLQESMVKSSSEKGDDSNTSKYPISIFALVGGVWLGDVINREHSKGDKVTGFGKIEKNKSIKKTKRAPALSDGFAEWTTGVQKVAMTFQWDYGKVIRQKLSFGNAMGVPVSNSIPNVSRGEVIVNENLLSRRRAIGDSFDKGINNRMIYMDFDSGSYAACIIGSSFIKAPRTLSFSFKTGKMQNFYTEFSVFQKREVVGNSSNIGRISDTSSAVPTELYCSRMTRLYGGDGRLLQASSSFFNLDRLMVDT